ncbi:uncharacterized protein LOC134193026 [Corticium candelabrum]|uniref:uncharacterized protein LOC134193026 n=1 Tax=Corticium candelabrum TaxID=121492 RepID=UPI002E2717F9|nr:uncharacterized protein LOC134193026 [Corticium candelabrum]
MMLCAVTDPNGVQERRGRKLKRRVYRNKGPNYLWHMDGYDKLKPYGFACHACIDGFSRRILWLHVAITNNQPDVIAGYFLACIEALGGCPKIIRADGTVASLR